jgi:hypothetical protein
MRLGTATLLPFQAVTTHPHHLLILGCALPAKLPRHVHTYGIASNALVAPSLFEAATSFTSDRPSDQP